MNEMVSGVRSDLGIKLFGDDFKVLTEEAGENREGVTACPLYGHSEESLTGNRVAIRIEPSGLPLDALLLERLPVAADPHAAKVQHRLSSRRCPVHPRPFHAILNKVAASPFDHPAGNGIARPQIHIMAHPPPIFLEVAAQPSHALASAPPSGHTPRPAGVGCAGRFRLSLPTASGGRRNSTKGTTAGPLSPYSNLAACHSRGVTCSKSKMSTRFGSRTAGVTGLPEGLLAIAQAHRRPRQPRLALRELPPQPVG